MIKKIVQLITVVLILSLSLPLPVQAATGFTVSGKVSTSGGTLAGVTLALGSLTAITNASGNYTISNVPAGTSGLLTPSLTGYTFNPVNISLNVTANRAGQNFTATQLTYSISGKVTKPDLTGLQGVSVFGVLTDVNGNYTIPNRPYGSTTNLTPTKGGYTFNPPSISVPAITANVTGQNFIANSAHSYTVSGTITSGSGPVGGVKVTLDSIYSDTTNGNGNFAIHNVPDGTAGDLVPSLAGYTFAPTSLSVASLTGDLTGQNFVATQITFNISGSVTDGTNPLSGVKVAITGTSYSTNTGADGSYTLANVPYGTSGALTPTASEYAFTPPSINIPGLTGSLSGQNFVGAKLYVVSGKVTVGSSSGAGLPNVVVALGAYSDTTAADGSYNIHNVPGGTSGNLTPSLAGYTFNPPNISVNNLQADTHQDNFIATLNTYTITGTVKLGASALQNVTIAISGTAFTTSTAADGSYTLANVPYGTTGDLSANLAGYSFAPPSIHLSNLAGNLSGQDFAAIKVYTLSGKITIGTSGGPALANVLVSLGAYSDTTASDGTYVIQNIPAGSSASLTPVLAGYTFNPANISINNLQSDTSGQDFVATLNTYKITGSVTLTGSGLSGVTVAISGTVFTTTTAANGTYTLANVPYGTTGDLTPSLAGGYSFAPASRLISNLGGDLSGQNFAATRLFSISGKVTLGTSAGSGLQNVLISLGTFTTTTAPDGSYTLTNVPSGTTGSLTPSLAGYAFAPANIPIASLASSQTDQNFIANVTYNISGRVTLNGNDLVGVKVALGGYQALTDANGNYSVNGVPSGTSGSLTPSKTNFTFTPLTITISNLSGNTSGQNFTATAAFSISGKVTSGTPATGLAGVTVALGPYNTITAADGTYTIPAILPGTKGTLIPSLTGYTFKPASLAVAAMTADLSNKNFVATQTKFTISGKVTINNKAGLKGVVLQTTSSGLTIPNVVTNSSGNFAISNLPSNHIYTVTPVLAGYSFSPPSFVSPALLSNQTANFAATLLFENISGTVSGLGGTSIQIRYGAGATQFVTTNPADGTYAINNLPENVSYTLTPISPLPPLLTLFRFNPTSLVIPAGNGSTSSANFAAALQVVMSGNLSVQGKAIHGVTVSAAGNSALTDSHGNYSLWVPSGVALIVSAAHPYFTFADSSLAAQSSDFKQNWSLAEVIVTGHVLLNGSGLAGVVVSASAAKNVTPVSSNPSDGTGLYTLIIHDTDTPNLASFVVTPALIGYTFSPKSQTVSPSAGKSKNFISIPNKWNVSGLVTFNSKGLGGVEIDATLNGVLHKVLSNSAGAFTVTGVPFGGSVSLIAKKTGLTFTPPSISFTMTTNANLPGQDFVAN
ncbi:MAG: carboxypeptidase regulatory-like domain-containing protein [Anaerolineaceae bacterium]|nr:carboxypeptidase regulatory-like domain-containing protein [Anaerolineaceae bacterium]